MREFHLAKRAIPGLKPDKPLGVFFGEPPNPASLTPIEIVDCQIHEGCAYMMGENGMEPNPNEPRVIVYCTNLESSEIPQAQWAAARQYILEAGDYYSDIALIAPEQQTVVCFSDERNKFRFFNY